VQLVFAKFAELLHYRRLDLSQPEHAGIRRVLRERYEREPRIASDEVLFSAGSVCPDSTAHRVLARSRR